MQPTATSIFCQKTKTKTKNQKKTHCFISFVVVVVVVVVAVLFDSPSYDKSRLAYSKQAGPVLGKARLTVIKTRFRWKDNPAIAETPPTTEKGP